MTQSLDETMERASEALVAMDYLGCEALCLQALSQARRDGNWSYYAAVLLPLQEARRQRRMIAAEGVIRLGTGSLRGGPAAWLSSCGAGCIVLTRPNTPDDARHLAREARHERRFIEVLFADNASGAPRWTLRSFNEPLITCEVEAPHCDWIEKNLKPDKARVLPVGQTPADWFIDATESLGDAALALAGREPLLPQRLDLLEKMLDAAADHELLHQALGKTAREMGMQQKAASLPTGVS